MSLLNASNTGGSGRTNSVRGPILVVDDDDAIREALALVLELRGYPAVAVANGAQALKVLDEGLRPCLIVLDLMMPEMDGIEFRQRQCENPEIADIPVVMLSAAESVEHYANLLRAEVYLRKPLFEFDKLFEVVAHYRPPEEEH
ncbi:MAG TPA: response regulator [Candidatus Acidoferrales bacterium]|nr:response regulator [Candidatus Acidoferrales bacterium]